MALQLRGAIPAEQHQKLLEASEKKHQAEKAQLVSKLAAQEASIATQRSQIEAETKARNQQLTTLQQQAERLQQMATAQQNHQAQTLAAQQASHQAELEAAQRQHAALLQQTAQQANQQQAQLQAELTALQAAHVRAGEERAAIEAELRERLERMREEHALQLQEREAELQESKRNAEAVLSSQVQVLRSRVQELEAAQNQGSAATEAQAERMAALREQLSTAEARCQELERNSTLLRRSLQEADDDRVTLRRVREELQGEVRSQGARLAEQLKTIQNLDSYSKTAEANLEARAAEIQGLQAIIADLRAQSDAGSSQLTDQEQRRQAAESALAAARQAHAEELRALAEKSVQEQQVRRRLFLIFPKGLSVFFWSIKTFFFSSHRNLRRLWQGPKQRHSKSWPKCRSATSSSCSSCRSCSANRSKKLQSSKARHWRCVLQWLSSFHPVNSKAGLAPMAFLLQMHWLPCLQSEALVMYLLLFRIL